LAVWDLDPVVPVMVTSTVEAEANLQESVDPPDPVTLFGVTVHAVLFVARLTMLVKP
jgi:hypothetical protein